MDRIVPGKYLNMPFVEVKPVLRNGYSEYMCTVLQAARSTVRENFRWTKSFLAVVSHVRIYVHKTLACGNQLRSERKLQKLYCSIHFTVPTTELTF